MRLGRIRGTIAELSELIVAVDFPTTVSAWFARELRRTDVEIPESGLVTAEEVVTALDTFVSDPHAAFDRYFGTPAEPVSPAELDAVVHEAYMRQVAQPVDMEKNEETVESMPALVANIPNGPDLLEEQSDPDADMREYLLALAREHLSPVLARALSGSATSTSPLPLRR